MDDVPGSTWTVGPLLRSRPVCSSTPRAAGTTFRRRPFAYRGLVDIADLGRTLLHDRVFMLSGEILQNGPGNS